jgi:CheY-like chemotaxis protein
VLVAEDDALLQDIVCHFLREEGYGVVSAYTYCEAVQALTAERFDLLLADTLGASSMERGSARWAMLERIRELAAGAPVVIMTGHRAELFGDFAERGFRDLLCKPFTLRRLLTLVEQHVADVSPY